MAAKKEAKKLLLNKPVKFTDKNIGRKVMIRGEEREIDFISANNEKFRVSQGEGSPVLDFDLEDIEEAIGLVIDIRS